MENALCSLHGKKIHFMGAGGIGVSALALMARHAGADVSACDRSESAMTRKLRRAGVRFDPGHDAAHIEGVDLLVHTSAVPDSHPERAAAAAAGVPQERRGRFLARLMDAQAEQSGQPSLGVSGTHGKTTTSWLLAQILLDAGRDPSVFIGGVATGFLSFGNHRTGKGCFVSELDESDGTFLYPKLGVAVINNIESDHLSHYGTDENLLDAFRAFARGVERDGVLVAGMDNAAARDIFTAHSGRKFGFGIDVPADFRAVDIAFDPWSSEFSLAGEKSSWGRFRLPTQGRHNILNALAALAAATAAGVDPERAKLSLACATGVGRRMEILGRWNGPVWYSDYAHHPTEVAATIDGLRQRHAGGIMVVFQPHLFSRTRDYAAAFAAALAAADRVLLVDIYPAREEPLPGVTSEIIAAPLRARAARGDARCDVHGPVSLADVPATAERLSAGMAAVVMMGAGDIDDTARAMASAALSVTGLAEE